VKWKIVKNGKVLGYDNDYKEALRVARIIGAGVEPVGKPKQITLE